MCMYSSYTSPIMMSCVSLFAITLICTAAFWQKTLVVNGQPMPEHPEPSTFYPIFVQMLRLSKIELAKAKDTSVQFVAGLMMSPSEVAGYTSTGRIPSQRFHVYTNKIIRRKSKHGEIQLIENLDTDYFSNYDYENEGEPYLLLYTTNIPCHRCDSMDGTYCAQSLNNDVQDRRSNDDRKKYQLVIAFFGIYFRSVYHRDCEKTHMDVTVLDTAVNFLMPVSKTAYFIKACTRNEPLPILKSQKNIFNITDNEDNYGLSAWLGSDIASLSALQSDPRYQRCRLKVQHVLFYCLFSWLSECECIWPPTANNQPQPVLVYAIDFAMGQCIHLDDAPLHNANSNNYQGMREALGNCLHNEWVQKIGYGNCNTCRGKISSLAGECVNSAINTAVIVGCPSDLVAGWDVCDRLDTGYDSRRLTVARKPQCRIRGMSPEYLCTRRAG